MDTTTITNNFKTEEYQINMGPQHPATHGVLRLLLTIDGEIIKKVEPDLGYIHRSIEKLDRSNGLSFFAYQQRSGLSYC